MRDEVLSAPRLACPLLLWPDPCGGPCRAHSLYSGSHVRRGASTSVAVLLRIPMFFLGTAVWVHILFFIVQLTHPSCMYIIDTRNAFIISNLQQQNQTCAAVVERMSATVGHTAVSVTSTSTSSSSMVRGGCGDGCRLRCAICLPEGTGGVCLQSWINCRRAHALKGLNIPTPRPSSTMQ